MARERYEVQGDPKSGEFGDVYKVLDTTLEIERAFKKIRVKDDAERASVIREARLQVRLGSHPNIVQIYDVIEGDTFVALVMDWVEGQTLAKYLQSKGALEKAEALAIIEEVLKALEFAHNHNILHSDIKLSNVMRANDANGSIWLVDFGVARTLGTHGMGTALGVTYAYAPPEFFQPPYKLDTRADLWATGVMLYQLVVGQLPFTVEIEQADNPFAWAGAITPCQYVPPADKELQALLQRVLVPLDKRLTTAQAFREAFAQKTAPVSPRFFPLLEAYKSQMVQIPQGIHKQKTESRRSVYEERPLEGFAGLLGKTTSVEVGSRPIFREIKVPAFRIGHTHVTVEMWKEYCQATGNEMPELPEYPIWQGGWDTVLSHPIVRVSAEECEAYANWAGLALPTEIQWEYAASSGDGREYPWGDLWDVHKCHCSKKHFGDSGGTSAVGSYPTGPFGLYDMVGNAWDLCTGRRFQQPIIHGGSWFTESNRHLSCWGPKWYNQDFDRGEISFRLTSV